MQGNSIVETPGNTSADSQPLSRDTLERLAERLRDTEELFQSWFEDVPIACHEIDRDGVVLRVNRAECDLLGFEPEEMLGRRIWDFMAPSERKKSREWVSELVNGTRSATPFEREYTRQDGARLVVEIHPKVMRDSAGRAAGIRSFMLDITAKKQADEELRQQARKLARSNAELEQFAYVASHDLQEPLRKIQAFGDRLKIKCGAGLNPDAEDCLKRMQNAAARMQTLIHDLLSLSRVSSQSQPLVPVDLSDVLGTVLSDLEIQIEGLGARLDIGPLPVIPGDRVQLGQLLQNIIGNALKFHKPGHPPQVAVFSRAAQGQPDLCEIVVEDCGIGFDEKYLDRIFQIFQRLHGRSEYEGTGIGLAICRKIAERHGGSISATSAPGEGARFVITLPCRQLQGGSPQ